MHRQTEQRTLILRTIKMVPDPISRATIERRLRKHGVSRATLYRALKEFVAGGQIAMIENFDGKTAYVGHAFHQSMFRCQRCGKERHLKSQTLPGYVDRKMFGHQAIVTSQLIAQGLCGSCSKKRAG